MGGQSQKRKNSTTVKKNRPSYQLKRATKKTIQEESVFDAEKDCQVCYAQKNKTPVPHRSHHDKCLKKRANKEKLNPPHQRLKKNQSNKPLVEASKWTVSTSAQESAAFVRGEIRAAAAVESASGTAASNATVAPRAKSHLILAPRKILPKPQSFHILQSNTSTIAPTALLNPIELTLPPRPVYCLTPYVAYPMQYSLQPRPVYCPVPYVTYPSQSLVSNRVGSGSKRKRSKLEVEYCCTRMHSWCLQTGRKGRMPHNDDCQKREKNRTANRRRRKSTT